ncbi:MAG: glycerophosphodiester phosphodiesterase [Gammaproteobacteria bacterium]|nr:glycerophosphodiester phosphodiesterase [Gammaproteobacteria bacterium]
MKVPGLVAHRGYSKNYPENTYIALETALKSGALYVEFDIQFCKDGVPVVLHDSNLKRTAGIDKSIFDMHSKELHQIPVGEPAKFGDKFNSAFIPTLEEIVSLIGAWPNITAFIEIKRASLKQFNKDDLINKIINVISPVKNQCVIISFDKHAVEIARESGAQQIGWVFEPWDHHHEHTARNLAPEYLFTDYSSFPKRPHSLWSGPWKWALYEINEPKLILEFAHLGADLIETNNIGELIKNPLLRKHA